jgi:pimeloyl-ACP methyl ester carboxylesterase
MSEFHAPGVEVRRMATSRLATRVLLSGPPEAEPVLFLHGHFSSASWWEETMASLPGGFRGISFDQRGFGDADPARKVEASLGLADCALDVVALLDALSIAKAHVVGNSLGGNILWRLMAEYGERIATATLVAPGSPFGFGGTKTIEGTPCWPDHAGSGAGVVSRHLVDGLVNGDRHPNEPFSPREILQSIVLGRRLAPQHESHLLEGMFATHIGPEDTPGDIAPSTHWPYFSPGRFGPANALSARNLLPPSRITAAAHPCRVLWVRGSLDQVVSDDAASDPGRLGRAGVIPGWPGQEAFPSQPMIGQTRHVLEGCRASGGTYIERIIHGAGHVPYITHPREFNELFHPFLLSGSARGR